MISRKPPDLAVSRRAGKLTAVAGGVLVSNESGRHSLFLQANPGPEFEIKPHMTVGTMPYGRCQVVVLGSYGARYVLDIDCRALPTAPGGPQLPEPAPASGVPTCTGYQRLNLPPAQRRYLAALCEPLLTSIGAGPVPATYAQISGRCGVSPRTVRHALDNLRLALSQDYGIPGLMHAGTGQDGQPGTVNFLAALAAWAIDSGNAGGDDLDLLG